MALRGNRLSDFMKTLFLLLSLLFPVAAFGAPASTLYIEKQGGVGNNNKLTNVSVYGSAYFQSNAVISNVTKKASSAASHLNPFLHVHSGDPTLDTFWSWNVGSATNTFDANGTFDYIMSWGFNSFSSPFYKANAPTLAYGLENHYVTSLGVNQSEHYMSFAVNSTNTHGRPWGWSYIWTYPPTIYHNWDLESWEFLANDGLGTLSMHKEANHTNQAYFAISRSGYLDFSANTNFVTGFNSAMIKADGHTLFGNDTNGFTALSSVQIGTTNVLSLFPEFDPSTYSLWLTFGRGTYNSRRGIAWNSANSRMEYRNTEANASWIPFYDSVAESRTWIQGVSLGTNAGDFIFLGYITNVWNAGQVIIEVDMTSYAYQSAHWVVPLQYDDANDASWREVLPQVNTYRYVTNTTISFDVKGRDLRLRRNSFRGDTSADTPDVMLVVHGVDKFTKAVSTGTNATVVGLFRNAAISQLVNKVGIGTNIPQATLHVVGDSSIRTNVAQFDIVVTDFTINTWYTNDNRRAVVSLSFELDANTTGTAKAGIYVDQAVDGTFETTKTVQSTGLADPDQFECTAWLQPGARFAITNLSSGAGSPTAAVVTGSCQWVKQ